MEGDENEIAYKFKMPFSFMEVSFCPNINIMHKEKCKYFFYRVHFILMQKEKSMFLLIKLVTGR